jgi:hypothetical protein
MNYRFHPNFSILNLPHSLVAPLIALSISIIMFAHASYAKERVIYTFKGGNDGAGPTDLLADSSGNLFGTTFSGGPEGAGTAYELSPPTQKGGVWTETILYDFSYSGLLNGIGPMAGFVSDSTGNLYGTTWLGGPNGGGIVFELSPPTANGASWTFSVLYGFGSCAYDLISPESRLAIDANGNLYGTTVSGGTGFCAGGCGGVFQLSPPSQPGGSWTENILFNFPGWFNEEGGGIGGTSGGVILDANGALYGTAIPPSHAWGTIFKLTPPKHKKGKAWAHSLLYSFQGGADGFAPTNLVIDNNGNIFGTTTYGGSGSDNCYGSSCGTIFQLSPTPSGPWTHTVLYNFNGGTDGGIAYPGPPLTLDADGNIYGTTPVGGDPSCADNSGVGCGTVFLLAPPAAAGNSWTETVLYRFAGGSGGFNPGGLIFGRGGQLYGAAGGGVNDDGLVFSIAP